MSCCAELIEKINALSSRDQPKPISDFTPKRDVFFSSYFANAAVASIWSLPQQRLVLHTLQTEQGHQLCEFDWLRQRQKLATGVFDCYQQTR